MLFRSYRAAVAQARLGVGLERPDERPVDRPPAPRQPVRRGTRRGGGQAPGQRERRGTRASLLEQIATAERAHRGAGCHAARRTQPGCPNGYSVAAGDLPAAALRAVLPAFLERACSAMNVSVASRARWSGRWLCGDFMR